MRKKLIIVESIYKVTKGHRGKIENNVLSTVYDTDMTLNYFVARTEKLRQCRWVPILKVGEHEKFFMDWWDKGFKCASTPNVIFGESIKHGKISTQNFTNEEIKKIEEINKGSEEKSQNFMTNQK